MSSKVKIQRWRGGGGDGGGYRYLDDLTESELAAREEVHNAYLQGVARSEADQQKRWRLAEEKEKLAEDERKKLENSPGFVFAKPCTVAKGCFNHSQKPVFSELLQEYGSWAFLGTGTGIGRAATPLKLISSPSNSFDLARRLGGHLSLGLIAEVVGTGVAAGAVVGTIALLMPNNTSEDSAFYKREQYDLLEMGATQVRVHIKQLTDGAIEAYGFYTGDGSSWGQVPIIRAVARGETFIADLGQGIELIWTPAVDTSTILGIPKLQGAPPPKIVEIYSSSEQAGRSLENPVYPPDYQDAILVFPVETGLQPIYVVLSLSADHRYHPAPNVLPAFPTASRAPAKTYVQGGGKKRPRWKDDSGKIYEWDFQH